MTPVRVIGWSLAAILVSVATGAAVCALALCWGMLEAITR